MTTETSNIVEEQVATTENTEATQEVTTEVESKEDDFSWVPKKFLKNGEPDLQGMAKSYQALEKRLGSKTLASDAIEDYAYETKHNLNYDPEVSQAFKSEAQKMGLSPEQYAWAMEKYEESVVSSGGTAELAEQNLRDSWGKSFDTNIRAARKAWDEFAPSDMDINEVGNNPAVIKILARIGQELGEDKPSAKSTSRPGAITEEQINEIIRSKDYSTDLKKQETVRLWYEKQYG